VIIQPQTIGSEAIDTSHPVPCEPLGPPAAPIPPAPRTLAEFRRAWQGRSAELEAIVGRGPDLIERAYEQWRYEFEGSAPSRPSAPRSSSDDRPAWRDVLVLYRGHWAQLAHDFGDPQVFSEAEAREIYERAPLEIVATRLGLSRHPDPVSDPLRNAFR
jgi:hypothetical protein